METLGSGRRGPEAQGRVIPADPGPHMKPVPQSIRHDPENGNVGDCYRCCLATLLELPVEDVPHFAAMDGGEYWGEEIEEARRKWLADRNVLRIEITFDGSGDDPLTVGDVLEWAGKRNPGIPFILCGSSGRYNHSVVAVSNEIVWDPAQRDMPIVGPCNDDFFRCEFIVRPLNE